MEWFRSKHGAPTHRKWLSVARKCGQPVPVVVSVVWALMDHASRNDDRGSVAGFECDDHDAYLSVDDGTTQSVIDALQAKGWIEDGRITSWEEHQAKREDGSAERAKAWRERKKEEAERERTQANASEPPDTDTDSERDRKNNYAFAGRVIRLTPEDFARWQTAYRNIDLPAALQSRDDYLASRPPDEQRNWFHSTSRWLQAENDKAAAKERGPPKRKAAI